MSSKQCAGSVRSGAGSVRLGGGAGVPSGHELVLDALYERKRDKKSVRVLTVLVYVLCVSLAAIILSLYYVFFWEPKDAHSALRKVAHTLEQPSTTPMPTCFMTHTGRSGAGIETIAKALINSTALASDDTLSTASNSIDPWTESSNDNNNTSSDTSSTYDITEESIDNTIEEPSSVHNDTT